MGNLFPIGAYDKASTYYVVIKDWIEAHQYVALSKCLHLTARGAYSDFYSTSAGANDGTWSPVGNPVSAVQCDSGAMALGGFTEDGLMVPFGLSAGLSTPIKSMRHGNWYVVMRSGITGALCTNAGSRQALVACVSNNLNSRVCFGFAPALSATNLVLWYESGNVVQTGGSAVSNLVAGLQAPTTDYALYFDGTSVIAMVGDPLNGVAMNTVAEIFGLEIMIDLPAMWAASTRIVTEAGGPTVSYDKALCIGPVQR